MLGQLRWVGIRALFALSLVLIVAVGIWYGVWPTSAMEASAEGTCGDSYAEPPLGPERPTRLVAFRKLVEDAPDPQQDITLHWVNGAGDADCLAVEVNYLPRRTATGDDWSLLDTLRGGPVTEYHHRVSALGEVCYRVYSSNEAGRSQYSNRVCLALEGYTPPPTVSAPAGPSASNSDGVDESGSLGWPLLVIAIALGALFAGAGLVLWRYKAHRSRARRT